MTIFDVLSTLFPLVAEPSHQSGMCGFPSEHAYLVSR